MNELTALGILLTGLLTIMCLVFIDWEVNRRKF